MSRHSYRLEFDPGNCSAEAAAAVKGYAHNFWVDIPDHLSISEASYFEYGIYRFIIRAVHLHAVKALQIINLETDGFICLPRSGKILNLGFSIEHELAGAGWYGEPIDWPGIPGGYEYKKAENSDKWSWVEVADTSMFSLKDGDKTSMIYYNDASLPKIDMLAEMAGADSDYGNLDWIRENEDKSIDILTWRGTPTRHFRVPVNYNIPNISVGEKALKRQMEDIPQRTVFGHYLYRQGSRFATAPQYNWAYSGPKECWILGAALYRDPVTEEDDLLIICQSDREEAPEQIEIKKGVFKTLTKGGFYTCVFKQDKTSEYLLGWELLWEQNTGRTGLPWFFNSKGTSAWCSNGWNLKYDGKLITFNTTDTKRSGKQKIKFPDEQDYQYWWDGSFTKQFEGNYLYEDSKYGVLILNSLSSTNSDYMFQSSGGKDKNVSMKASAAPTAVVTGKGPTSVGEFFSVAVTNGFALCPGEWEFSASGVSIDSKTGMITAVDSVSCPKKSFSVSAKYNIADSSVQITADPFRYTDPSDTGISVVQRDYLSNIFYVNNAVAPFAASISPAVSFHYDTGAIVIDSQPCGSSWSESTVSVTINVTDKCGRTAEGSGTMQTKSGTWSPPGTWNCSDPFRYTTYTQTAGENTRTQYFYVPGTDPTAVDAHAFCSDRNYSYDHFDGVRYYWKATETQTWSC